MIISINSRVNDGKPVKVFYNNYFQSVLMYIIIQVEEYVKSINTCFQVIKNDIISDLFLILCSIFNFKTVFQQRIFKLKTILHD